MFNLCTKLLTKATFADPIDAAELREHFAFPPSIHVSDDGLIQDGPNHFAIYYDRPAKLFSFELPPETGAPAAEQGRGQQDRY